MRSLPSPLARRFEALVFDWDGTAVPDRHADAAVVRRLVEALCDAGVSIAVVSGTHLGNVDPQLRARPTGPGRLYLALNRGSELFEVGTNGPMLITRREATPTEDSALTRAAEKIVNRLSARGLEARVVSQRLNRRKIDLIPEPEWEDPPKAIIDRLVHAVQARVRQAGFSGIGDVARLAEQIAREEGLDDPKITSDAKHIEVGLTDKRDSARELLAALWHDGIAPEQICIGGDEFGDLAGMPGSDALMLVPEAAGAIAMSVGVEPDGVPQGVVHVPGGPERFVEFLGDQLLRRIDVPDVPAIDEWSVVVDGPIDPTAERSHGAVLSIADGVVGTTGAPLLHHAAARPDVVGAGIYDGAGPTTDLLAAPRWATLDRDLGPDDRVRRVLDLHGGVLGERVDGATILRSARFASLARPGVVALRADVDPPDASPPLATPSDGFVHGDADGVAWMATHGSGGSVTVAALQDRNGARLERVAAYVVGADGPLPDDAVEHLRHARAAGFNHLLVEHRRAWCERWACADVELDGDPSLQRALRLALYHLMSSTTDVGEAAVGARGLTGRAYRGHVFWDADLFVLPFLAATHADAARAMLEYRIRRLG
ncbi:MAG TPA: hypothetical protein VFR41_02175, partial [Acidimicrobiia bacterium]|nr:hypothetical protein [Acidimicrobiia bacterium]